ncbi:alpha-galactosidase [Lacticaseibacillus paracasei]|nr:alpha-galactosidase [Lacticaseibacillus paracasei]
MTRSQLQKPEHKDLGRNDQRGVITSKAAYTPVSPALAPAHAHKKGR